MKATSHIFLFISLILFCKVFLVHFSLPKTWKNGTKIDGIAKVNDIMTFIMLGFGLLGFVFLIIK